MGNANLDSDALAILHGTLRDIRARGRPQASLSDAVRDLEARAAGRGEVARRSASAR